MPLMPAGAEQQFATTRLRPGYDEEEVDAFLDEVETRWRGSFRRIRNCGRSLPSAWAARRRCPPELALTEADPERLAAEPVLPEPQRTPEPALMGVPGEMLEHEHRGPGAGAGEQYRRPGPRDARREP